MTASTDWLTEDPRLASLLRHVAEAPALGRADLLTAASLPNEGATDGTIAVERPLGGGGMGVVYLAEHTRLHRKIAVKLNRADTPRARAALLREARAIAAIEHDNVIEVLDLGNLGGHVFVAMAYMDGGTARSWLAERPRHWTEVVALYRKAAMGLVAAHERGVVHCDFKPDNVLLSRDGRVCVADFGLARAAAATTSSAGTSSDSGAQSADVPSTIAGTPAYMAPEVLAGRAPTAASDQFSFCASLREALLSRSRPVPGVEWPRSGPAIPRWLRRVVQRGLSTDPARRFDNLRALVTALEGPRSSRVHTWTAAALGLAATFAIAAGSWSDPCDVASDELSGIWDTRTRRELQGAFTDDRAQWSTATWGRVSSSLDRYASDWTDARRKACEAGRVAAVPAAGTQDRQLSCLQRRRQALAATVDVLRGGGDDVVAGADAMVASLPAIAECADTTIDDGLRPEDGAEADRVRSLLATAAARLDAGQIDEAERSANEGLALARAIGAPGIVAEALLGRVHVTRSRRQHDRAKAAAEEGLAAAGQAGDDLLAARLAVALASASRYGLREDDGGRSLQQAEALVMRAGAPPQLQAALSNTKALVARVEGRPDDAIAELRRALALIDPDDVVEVGRLRGSLASTMMWARRYDEAMVLFDENIAMLSTAFGDEHPLLAQELNNAGGAEFQRGNLRRSRELLERALVMRRNIFGPDAAVTGETLLNLGVAARAAGDLADAKRWLRQAEHAFAEEDGGRGRELLLATLADVTAAEGDLDGAAALRREHIDFVDAHFPPEESARVNGRYNLAALELDRGNEERASEWLDEALALLATRDRDNRPDLGPLLALHGKVAHARGDRTLALVDYTAAVLLLDATPGYPDTFRVDPLAGAGAMFLELGNAEAAAPYLRRALEVIGDTNPTQLGHIEAALASAEQILADAETGEPHPGDGAAAAG